MNSNNDIQNQMKLILLHNIFLCVMCDVFPLDTQILSF